MSVQQISIEQRRKLVAANLLAGATYAEIANVLNVSKGTVASDYKAILKEWREHYAAKADKFLALQLRRLDVILNALWEDVQKGTNLQKIDRALAIMDRQNALLGLSKGVTLSTTNVTVPIQIVEVNLTEEESPLMLQFEEGA